MTRTTRNLVVVSAAAGLLVTATGCSTTMRDLPIPGTGVSGDTIELKAEFDEALNLAEGAPVKVNGVDSGKVSEIGIDDYTAVVTMDVRTDAELHEGATARLRYTTPLGELFVDITNPPQGEELPDGSTLTLEQTATAPTVEDALAQASLLINGGGLDQLQTITEELNTALGGNEEDVRLLLTQAATFLTEANATTSSIDAVLTSLNSLSGTLGSREAVINRAMKEIRPAAAVLRRATPELTALLKAVQRFSATANETVSATREQLLALLGEVEPVLAELASNRGPDSGGDFATAGFSDHVEDLIAAASFLEARGEAPALLVGHSLGGAAAIAAASRIASAKAVVTIAAPFEVEHVLDQFGSALGRIETEGEAEVTLAGREFQVSREFLDETRGHDQAARLAELDRALLVLHSPRDAVVGIDNAGEIFQAARHPKSFVSLDGANHLLTRAADADYAAGVIAAWAGRWL